MRDRSKEIDMLEDTLKILKQGWYEKNGKRIQLKLSEKEMQEIQVYLPDDVKKNCSDPDFSSPFVVGRYRFFRTCQQTPWRYVSFYKGCSRHSDFESCQSCASGRRRS